MDGTLLDELLPQYEFSERRALTVAASPARVLEAVEEVTPADIPWLNVLLGIRSLPARLVRKAIPVMHADRSLLEQMVPLRFRLLGVCRGEEIVIGQVDQAWKATGGASPVIRTAEEFVAFDLPGYAKSAASFRVEDLVVVISADATPGQIRRMRAAGARAYLTKPLDARWFLNLLDEVLSQGLETPFTTAP